MLHSAVCCYLVKAIVQWQRLLWGLVRVWLKNNECIMWNGPLPPHTPTPSSPPSRCFIASRVNNNRTNKVLC